MPDEPFEPRSSASGLYRLTALELSGNNLYALPSYWDASTNLARLALDQNYITGQLPSGEEALWLAQCCSKVPSMGRRWRDWALWRT